MSWAVTLLRGVVIATMAGTVAHRMERVEPSPAVMGYHQQKQYSAPGAAHASDAPSAHNGIREYGRNVDLTLRPDFASPDLPCPDAILTRTLRFLRPDCAWSSALAS